jgi:hypothetical protein
MHNLSFDNEVEFLYSDEELTTPLANPVAGKVDALSYSGPHATKLIGQGIVENIRPVVPAVTADELQSGYGSGVRFLYNDLDEDEEIATAAVTITNGSSTSIEQANNTTGTAKQATEQVFGTTEQSNGDPLLPLALGAFSVKVEPELIKQNGNTEFAIILEDRTVYKIIINNNGSSKTIEAHGTGLLGASERRLRLLGNI